MSPRGKDQENSDLPVNLTVNRNIFVYRRPIDGGKRSLGSDRALAIQTAKELNAHYARTGGVFDQVTAGDPIPEDTFGPCVAQFAKELECEGLAAGSLKEYRRVLGHIGAHFKDRPVDDITTREVSLFLRKYPSRTYNFYRSMLLRAFDYAKTEGLLTRENPVMSTKPKKTRVQRERLTLEQYRLVHAQATPHIQNAMDLALHTLQRREDIAVLRYADHHDGCIWVRPLKTRKHGTQMKIEVCPELQAVIARCHDGMLSPFMVHQPYAYRGKRLALSALSEGFRLARERARALRPDSFPVEPAKRPSFHEIRGLGALLYKQSGRDPQALLGHINPKTTFLYLSRHEDQWIVCSAGLDLTKFS